MDSEAKLKYHQLNAVCEPCLMEKNFDMRNPVM